MGRLIDTNDIRVKPQYMQDVMGIAMIRCEDLSRILAEAPTVEAIPKADYENRLKADMVAMLTEIQLEIEEMPMHYDPRDVSDLIQQKINALRKVVEMGMTIDTAITVLGMVEAYGVCIEAKDIAVDTMRKYQKIEQIVNNELEGLHPHDRNPYKIALIKEVIDNGNDNR